MDLGGKNAELPQVGTFRQLAKNIHGRGQVRFGQICWVLKLVSCWESITTSLVFVFSRGRKGKWKYCLAHKFVSWLAGLNLGVLHWSFTLLNMFDFPLLVLQGAI